MNAPYIRFQQCSDFAGWDWSVWAPGPCAVTPRILDFGRIAYGEIHGGYLDIVLDRLCAEYDGLEFGSWSFSWTEYP